MVVLIVYLAAAVLFFLLAVAGLRLRRLVAAAVSAATVAWIVLTILAPSHDQDWSKADYGLVVGGLAVGAVLSAVAAAALGYVLRARPWRTAR